MKKTDIKKLLTGSYSIGICAAAIAVVMLINILAAQLPSGIIRPDVTPAKLATVGKDSKNILANVDTDITIYRIYSESYSYATGQGGETQTVPVDENLKNLLSKYKDACKRITLKEIDPVKDPTFLAKYTDNTLNQNSLIVESSKRSICIDSAGMYLYEIVGYSDGTYMSYEDCTMAYQNIYYSYGDSPEVKEYFFAENEITGAIDYVTSDNIPIIYEITGHGEASTSTGKFGNLTMKENVELRTHTLASGDKIAVPDDAAAVLIYAPSADITKEELDALITYVDGGGDIIFFSFYEYISPEEMPNLTALTAHMGLEAIPEIICEADGDHYNQYPFYILPDVTGEGITKGLSDSTLFLHISNSHGIKAIEGAENVTAVSLINTTDKGFIFSEESINDPDKAEKAKYSLAYQSTVKDGGTLYWFATPLFIYDTLVNYSNGDMYRELLKATCDKPVSVSIIGKQVVTPMVQLTANRSAVWHVILLGVIPCAFVIPGFVIWYRRRKR